MYITKFQSLFLWNCVLISMLLFVSRVSPSTRKSERYNKVVLIFNQISTVKQNLINSWRFIKQFYFFLHF